MLLERRALVLREHLDAREPRVDEVREDDVDDAVAPAEGHRGLGAVERERVEALALPAGEDHHENLGGVELQRCARPCGRAMVTQPWRRHGFTNFRTKRSLVPRRSPASRGESFQSRVSAWVTEEVGADDVMEAGALDVADDEELVDAVGRLHVLRAVPLRARCGRRRRTRPPCFSASNTALFILSRSTPIHTVSW